MEFVELLRVRRALIWHAGILAVIAIGIMALAHSTTVNIDGPSGQTKLIPGSFIGWGDIAGICAFFVTIFASSLGTSLSRENSIRDISWTKPIARTLIAIRYILVDLGGLCIAFVTAFALIALVLVRMNFMPHADASVFIQTVLAIGIGAMWYGLLQMITCGMPPGGRAMAGIMWPVALFLIPMAQIPGAIGALVRAVNIINPLEYLGVASIGSSDPAKSFNPVGPLSLDERALVVWLFAALFCAIAVAVWPRQEA